MMNKKVTTYFLQRIRSKYKDIRNKTAYTQDKENYYLCDGYCMFAVKKEDMELNINRFKEAKGLKNIIKKAKDEKYKDAEIKYYIPDKLNKGKFLVKLENEDTKAYISNEFLNRMDATKFKILNELEPIACYREEKGKDVFLGIILPIRMSKEE